MNTSIIKPAVIKKPEKVDRKTELSAVQKGLISLGVVGGAVCAIRQKKGFWGTLAYLWVGSLLGAGLGQLAKEFKKKS